MFTALAQCGAFQFAGCGTINAAFTAVISTVNSLAILLAVLFLAIGGIKYITASGNKEKAGEAKQLLTQVLIGLAVVLGINIIMTLITSILPGGGTIKTPPAPTV